MTSNIVEFDSYFSWWVSEENDDDADENELEERRGMKTTYDHTM